MALMRHRLFVISLKTTLRWKDVCLLMNYRYCGTLPCITTIIPKHNYSKCKVNHTFKNIGSASHVEYDDPLIPFSSKFIHCADQDVLCSTLGFSKQEVQALQGAFKELATVLGDKPRKGGGTGSTGGAGGRNANSRSAQPISCISYEAFQQIIMQEVPLLSIAADREEES